MKTYNADNPIPTLHGTIQPNSVVEVEDAGKGQVVVTVKPPDNAKKWAFDALGTFVEANVRAGNLQEMVAA